MRFARVARRHVRNCTLYRRVVNGDRAHLACLMFWIGGGVQSIDDTVDIDDDILTELAYQMIRQGDVALTFKGHRYYLHAPGVYNRPNRILSGDDLNPCRLLGETGCILSVGERYSGGLLFRAAKDHMNCCWPKIDGLDEAFWHNRQHLLESVARRVETNNQD